MRCEKEYLEVVPVVAVDHGQGNVQEKVRAKDDEDDEEDRIPLTDVVGGHPMDKK